MHAWKIDPDQSRHQDRQVGADGLTKVDISVKAEPLGPDICKPESEAWGLCEGLQGHMCPTLPVSPTSVQVLEVKVLVDQVILVEERSPARANPCYVEEHELSGLTIV